MIGKPKFTRILAYLIGFTSLHGCGEDSKTLSIQYSRASGASAYNLQLVAIVSIGPNANTYAANISPLPASNGAKLEFYGRETSAAGAVDDSVIEKIKQCAVYESRGATTEPDLDPTGFVGGNVTSDSSCLSTGAAGYFTRGFGSDGKTFEVDPLSTGASGLIDPDNGYVLALFFNNSQGGPITTGTNSLKRCFQICGRKVQNKQFYSARSQALSDVLNCDLSALHCYDF